MTHTPSPRRNSSTASLAVLLVNRLRRPTLVLRLRRPMGLRWSTLMMMMTGKSTFLRAVERSLIREATLIPYQRTKKSPKTGRLVLHMRPQRLKSRTARSSSTVPGRPRLPSRRFYSSTSRLSLAVPRRGRSSRPVMSRPRCLGTPTLCRRSILRPRRSLLLFQALPRSLLVLRLFPRRLSPPVTQSFPWLRPRFGPRYPLPRVD